MSILLGVNIDHIATLRQARGTIYPEPLQAALLAEEAGADGITVHLREDRRHIQDRDVYLLKDVLQTRMNLEMAATDQMLAMACEIKPAYCCLVPEKREELTTEGGLDVAAQQPMLRDYCQQLADNGIAVSLFIDPDPKQIEAAVNIGAPIIELHTGDYAEQTVESLQQKALQRVIEAASMAQQAGLQVNAGHGLHYHNVAAIAEIPQLVELNIGHAIIARAVMVGLKTAVADMKRLLIDARS